MTKIGMMRDLNVLHEDVTTVNMQGLHTDVYKEDTSAKKEMPANNTHLYDGKHVTNQVARGADMHMDVDTKYVTTFKQPEAYETYQEEDVDKTYPDTNTKNISMMRVSTNNLPRTTTFNVEGLHTREDEEDLFTKGELPADNKVVAVYEYKEVPDVPIQEELPADNKVVTKSEYEGEPDVQNSATVPDVQDIPPQEELLAEKGGPTMYEYTHGRNVMTNQTETIDIAKMLAYMNKNYDTPSQMGAEDVPNADSEKNEPNVRENPSSIDEPRAVNNYIQINGVADKEEPRGSP
jgi:hypothetical protein